jgi:hypothetical protein
MLMVSYCPSSFELGAANAETSRSLTYDVAEAGRIHPCFS